MKWILGGLVILLFLVGVRVLTRRSHSRVPHASSDRGPRTVRSAPPRQPEIDPTPVAKPPEDFGYKMSWWAVRTEDPIALAQRIGLRDLIETNRTAGIDTAYEQVDSHALLTPALDGWVLVAAFSLPGIDDPGDVESITPLLERLGEQYPRVCSFGTHRVVEYHHWIRVEGGRLVRGFAYLGETGEVLWDTGEPTSEEIEAGFEFSDLLETWDELPDPEAEDFPWYPDEEAVMRIAGAWSIDPSTLSESDLPPSTCWIARVPEEW